MDSKTLGIKGEKAAAKFLKKNKYKILDKNYSTKYGEIDIIAQKGELIVFVEVKTRSQGLMLAPSLSVDKRKQRRIFSASSYYMSKKHTDKQPRYDVAEVIVNPEGKFSINYIENAFWQEDDYAVF